MPLPRWLERFLIRCDFITPLRDCPMCYTRGRFRGKICNVCRGKGKVRDTKGGAK